MRGRNPGKYRRKPRIFSVMLYGVECTSEYPQVLNMCPTIEVIIVELNILKTVGNILTIPYQMIHCNIEKACFMEIQQD